MRRAPLLALVLLVGITTSCGDTPTAIENEAAQLARTDAPLSPKLLLAGSDRAAEVIWAPFAFVVTGCEGEEDVSVEGFSHTVRKDPVPGMQNLLTFITVNAKGEGTGELTGARYVWDDHLTSYHYRENGMGSGLKGALHSRMIGQGSAPNLRFFGKVTYIVNANGDVTVDVEEAAQICK
jgi:hypothetical protein